MNAVVKARTAVPALKDQTLFRDRCYIDGKWLEADSGQRFDVDNPGDGTLVGSVPSMGAPETQRAIAAAQAAFPAWAALPAKERSKVLRKWFDLIVANADDLALLLTTEQGKPLAEAKGEVIYGASFVEWFAEEAKRVYGDVIPTPMNDRRLLVIKQPVGVVGAITPWNFPVAMITRKVAPGLAVGCTFVLKPAEQTPYCALALVELAERAGIPKGVFNVITGDGPTIGKELCASPVVRKITFTGSTEVGRILMRQSADTVKKLSLELGGNAPFVVFADADLDAAVEGAIASKYRNAGQTCVCANRIYVEDPVYDVFTQKLAAKIGTFKVGKGTDAGVTIGPLIDEQGLAKVVDHVADAQAKGAKLILGGKPHALGGRFFEPTLLTEVTPAMKVTREETFGPVAPLYRFKGEKEVIDLCNASEFGLASYFYSRDVGRVFRVAEALESGLVGVNVGVLANEMSPFGGVKQSGIGREGSKYGIDDFVSIKYIAVGGVQ
ncbi:NAD-dependent succinate-semialdehyde dehydrogenase [Usitatibacter palustris]|uniref:Glutarate-semialdehyde dehydrogenase n=1 Tax=Usitatibacter palustris TaxID=2732487 RepID=A0A6M4H8V1_9PROT|nr:NAD-dependent succinate-semialdehyde dehydrogenase [Usitatibacter palustris]QJR16149.1 Glutarate-semialdehyde dehydrogenase [Usitatibacter palustris]